MRARQASDSTAHRRRSVMISILDEIFSWCQTWSSIPLSASAHWLRARASLSARPTPGGSQGGSCKPRSRRCSRRRDRPSCDTVAASPVQSTPCYRAVGTRLLRVHSVSIRDDQWYAVMSQCRQERQQEIPCIGVDNTLPRGPGDQSLLGQLS